MNAGKIDVGGLKNHLKSFFEKTSSDFLIRPLQVLIQKLREHSLKFGRFSSLSG